MYAFVIPTLNQLKVNLLKIKNCKFFIRMTFVSRDVCPSNPSEEAQRIKIFKLNSLLIACPIGGLDLGLVLSHSPLFGQ